MRHEGRVWSQGNVWGFVALPIQYSRGEGKLQVVSGSLGSSQARALTSGPTQPTVGRPRLPGITRRRVWLRLPDLDVLRPVPARNALELPPTSGTPHSYMSWLPQQLSRLLLVRSFANLASSRVKGNANPHNCYL